MDFSFILHLTLLRFFFFFFKKVVYYVTFTCLYVSLTLVGPSMEPLPGYPPIPTQLAPTLLSNCLKFGPYNEAFNLKLPMDLWVRTPLPTCM